MKKLEFAKINKKIVCLSIINVVLILLLCLVGVSDETKDDLGLQLLISNCDGPAAYYHQYMSPYYTLGVFCLQKLFPLIAWNYFVQIIFILISINVLCKEIMDRMFGKLGPILAITTSVLLFSQSICIFNFTRTAALLVSAGLCLIFHNKKRDKIKGLLLVVCGTVVRFSVIYVFIVFITLILLWNFQSINNMRATCRQCVIPVITAVLMVFLVEAIGQFYVNSQPGWKKVQERCALSAKLMDYELDKYEVYEEAYKKIGISRNDYMMIEKRFSNSDTSYFTDEIYNQIYEKASKKWNLDLSIEQLENWVEEVKKYPMHNAFGWYILGVLVVAVICYDKKKRYFPIVILLCMGIYSVLFCVLGRVVDRVTFGLYLSAGTTLLICHTSDMYRGEKFREEKNRFLQGLLGVIYIAIAVFVIFIGNNYSRKTDAKIADMYDYMEKNQHHFYFYSQMSEYRAISNLLFMKNYWNTGNSMYASDYDFVENTVAKYRKYDIHNVYRDAPNSEVIRFIDCSEDEKSRIDMIVTYIREHYFKDASAELLDEIGKYRVYRIILHQNL